MDLLPVELQSRIASFLSPIDLRALRLVCKQCAAIARRPLFEVFRFSGRKQDEFSGLDFGPMPEPVVRGGILGRTRTVEFAKIPDAVDEVMDHSLAQCAKTFVFDPAYYREIKEDFWQDYLAHIENEMHEPVDEYDIDMEDWDEEDFEAAIERVLEQRRTRPDREAEAVEATRLIWRQKAEEQRQEEEKVVAALVKLFGGMTALRSIIVKPWEFSNRPEFGPYKSLGPFNSYEIDLQRRASFPSSFLLGVLARALYSASRSIKSLEVREFFAEQVENNPSTRHVFTGLREITLGVLHVEFLAEKAIPYRPLIELFKCAQPTLQRLSIVAGGKWPQMAARGGHSLLKILGDDPDESPLVFPKLEFICLRGLILSTPPLIKFLQAQPNLKNLEFGFIYLATPGTGWPQLAEALPSSVESWRLSGRVGHEPVNGDGPTAYNWMTPWLPQPPPSSRWRMRIRTSTEFFNQIDG